MPECVWPTNYHYSGNTFRQETNVKHLTVYKVMYHKIYDFLAMNTITN